MKVLICGAFDFVNLPCGGQPVKTRELYYALVERYGQNEVAYIDTYGWKRNPIALIFRFFKLSKKAQNLIMLPAHNGVTVISWLLLLTKKWWNKRIFYDVIGGWLQELLREKKRLSKRLSLFDGIWVETSSMKKALEEIGLHNVHVVHNFKKLHMVSHVIDSLTIPPLKVCIFSRIQEEKGVEDAVKAVKRINERRGEAVYSLDVYGPIDPAYEPRFNVISTSFPDYISYKGVVDPSQSVEVLQLYFALLFPTHYLTEGIPGTIIDAYASAVPVIAARWKNAGDVIDEGRTGLCYDFGNFSEFVGLLEDLVDNPSKLVAMRPYCLSKYHEFTPEAVVKQIDTYFE